MLPVDECSSSPCPSSSGCSNVLVVRDAPLVVNGNATALVGVATHVEAQCTCSTLTFDRCTSGSCLNGGTCQQLDHAFRSVFTTGRVTGGSHTRSHRYSDNHKMAAGKSSSFIYSLKIGAGQQGRISGTYNCPQYN